MLRRGRDLIFFSRRLQVCRRLLSGDQCAGEPVRAALQTDPIHREECTRSSAQHSFEDDDEDEYSSDDTELSQESHSLRSGDGAMNKLFLNKQRKQTLCLPTVFLPEKLQEAIEVVVSSRLLLWECHVHRKYIYLGIQWSMPHYLPWDMQLAFSC